MTGDGGAGSELSEIDEAIDAFRDRASGRQPLTEAQVNARAAGRGLPTIEDFRRVGLGEDAAADAARGLLEGVYFSFEDAVYSKAAFDTQGRTHVDPLAMSEAGERFTPGNPVQS